MKTENTIEGSPWPGNCRGAVSLSFDDSPQSQLDIAVPILKEYNLFATFYINPEGELFCSSHISVLRKAGVILEENTDVLPEFFVYRYVMPPRTLYKNIFQVTAGSKIYVKLINGRCVLQPTEEYFNPPEPGELPDSYEAIVKRTLGYLSESFEILNPRRDHIPHIHQDH